MPDHRNPPGMPTTAFRRPLTGPILAANTPPCRKNSVMCQPPRKPGPPEAGRLEIAALRRPGDGTGVTGTVPAT
jgi:hypothetical protein